jgi:hypothetical protein
VVGDNSIVETTETIVLRVTSSLGSPRGEWIVGDLLRRVASTQSIVTVVVDIAELGQLTFLDAAMLVGVQFQVEGLDRRFELRGAREAHRAALRFAGLH